jgi:hypothetical protein
VEPTNVCLACGHAVGSHLYPSGICVECAELQLARLDLHEEMHTRLDRLAFAVQVLTERLDAGRIEELERRLGDFVSSWPRREGAT